MGRKRLCRAGRGYLAGVRGWLGVFGLTVVLLSCNSGGDSGNISTPATEAPPALEQAAVQNLLDLYRTALLQEDIDRLQDLLTPDGAAFGTQSFLEATATTFRASAVTDVVLTEVALPSDAAPLTVSFRETHSLEDPVGQAQRTESWRTTWQLVRQTAASGVVTILVGAVSHEGPRFEITVRDQVQAGVAAAVEVRETSGSFMVAGVEVVVPETQIRTALVAEEGDFRGRFTPPALPHPQALQVHIRSSSGEPVVVAHRYRVRLHGEGVVEQIAEAGTTEMFAVALAPDGTVWAGGTAETTGAVGTIVQVAADGRAVLRLEQPTVESLPAGASGHIEDLAIDELGRVHALFLARVRDRQPGTNMSVVGNGDVVLDPSHPDLPCQTVNVYLRDPLTGESTFDPSYPFQVPDPQHSGLLPSPSTRILPAGGGDVWLFGSDGGVARVSDGFRGGECPEGKVPVRYDPVFRRGEGGLLSNTVPALVLGADGAAWFGTALGLTRLQDGEFTAVPFSPALSLQGHVATLEAFFREVAEAIFAARPVSSVGVHGVSFISAFGAPLVKEGLIFSAVEDHQGRLWVGTLGGGIRRIEIRDGGLRDTLHLARQAGLASNIIFALAPGPDGSIWVGTDEGVSRLQEVDGEVIITNFSSIDGLPVPVRDVAVAADGTVWLATAGGLFRLTTMVGLLRGVVRDAAGHPVAGALVSLLGTPFQAMTDADGGFVLANLPPGPYQLLVDGGTAVGGAMSAVVAQVHVHAAEEQTVDPFVVTPRPRAARLVPVSGDGQTGPIGVPLHDPLVVAVQDEQGQGVSGVAVTFRVLQGRGSVADGTGITDAGGVAAAAVTITAPGTLQVGATADGLGPVVFTATGVGGAGGGPGSNVRLIPVSGNNQSAEPGHELPEPLVVRLLDQFGKPIVGAPVTAEVIRGDGTSFPVSCQDGRTPVATAMTDESGQACFQLRAEVGSEEDIVVRVSALGETVQFLAIVGAVDTPDIPRDVAVFGDFVYIADRFSGLQVMDVKEPTHPIRLGAVELEGSEERLALEGNLLYVATDFPPRLYILDLRTPATPVVRGSVDLPNDVQNHAMTGVAVQGGLAYLVTYDRTTDSATLQVVDIGDPVKPKVVGNVSYEGRPADIEVAGNFAYVPAERHGLLVFNISNPATPILASIVQGNFTSSIALAGDFAYVVELLPRQDRSTENRFTVLDLRNPAAPQRRGTVQVPEVFQLDTRFPIAIAGRFAYLVEYAYGLEVFDTIAPDAPRSVGRIDTPSQALNVAATETFIYATDLVFGLQVIRGPGPDPADTDGDGVVDFFDAFPHDPTEWQDTDGDGIGDNADPDDDNDGFTDEEELQAVPPTDPKDPRSFPVRLPPSGTTTLIVDAASPFSPRERNGTLEAPYRSITEAFWTIRALQENGVAVQGLLVRAGKYSPVTTQEIFPLNFFFFRLPSLTMQGAGWETTVIDAGFTADVMTLISNQEVAIEGFTLTHGAHGLLINRSRGLTLRGNRITENALSGIEMGINSKDGNTITENLVHRNGLFGINLFENSSATVANNIFSENTSNGMFINVGSSAEIDSNSIMHNNDHGIEISLESTAIVINNTIAENFKDGLFISRDSFVDAIYNNISNNDGQGIQIFNNSNSTIVGNTVRENSRTGIFVVSNSTAQITENTIMGNDLSGIEVQNTSESRITDNVIHENGTNGIYIVINSNANISNNTIASNSAQGVRVERSSEALFIENSIRENNNAGIFILTDASAEIRMNNITGNRLSGIEVQGNSHAMVTNNILMSNAGNGIFVVINSSAELSDNTAADNKSNGIQIGIAGQRRDASFATISDGAIAENQGHGVAVFNASRANIGLTGSILTIARNAGVGIFVNEDGSSAQIDRSRIVFDNNGGGDISGNVIDLTPGPSYFTR